MLQYNPGDRLDMEGIKAHPWFTATMPSTAEINEEFANRWDNINQMKGEGDCPDEIDSTVFNDSSHAHRGEDDASEESKLPAVERKCKDWFPNNKITQFYSTQGADRLFNAVAAFANDTSALEYTFARDTYKAHIKMVEEDEEEPEIKFEVNFAVKILKVPD